MISPKNASHFVECISTEECPWFAVHVSPKHEKKVSIILQSRGCHCYVPIYRLRRKWSDRIMVIHQPIFPGYVFCRITHSQGRLVVSTPGVNYIVGFGGKPYPVPEEQIEAVRKIADSSLEIQVHNHFKPGDKVEIQQGPLAGVRGTLLKFGNQLRIVVSIDVIMSALSVEIDSALVARVRPPFTT